MPTFSICVPTRERDFTLRNAIESVLAQTYEDFELIIHDNFSSAATANVVKSFNDRRLRYFRSDRRLPMHENWEMALALASGDYLLFIGDDDALMPDCLARAEPLLKGFDPDILAWPSHLYYWPDCPDPAHRNLLIADIRCGTIWRDGFADDPFGANISSRFPGRPPGTLVFDSRSVARAWYAWQGVRLYVPAYHNIAARRVIDRVRERCGRYFLDPTPDFASLAVNIYFADKILYYARALSMSGHSGPSNGGTHGDAQSLDRNIETFLAEAGLTAESLVPAGVPPLVWGPSTLFGCFENVRRQAFPDDSSIPHQIQDFIRYAATEVGNQPHAHRDRCRAWVSTLALRHGVPESELSFAEAQSSVRPHGILNDPLGRAFYIHVDGESAGLRTIADAVRLAGNFSLQTDYPIEAPLPQPAAEGTEADKSTKSVHPGIGGISDLALGGITVRGAPLTALRILSGIARRAGWQ